MENSLASEEQEVHITRNRADKNLLIVDVSDGRVLKRCLKHYEQYITRRDINKGYKGIDGFGLVAIELQIPIKLFKKSIFFPYYLGDS
jgi:hypothetical protein